MENLDIIIYIANEICEGCGPDRDCEMDYEDCSRIQSALEILEGVNNG